jgi:hypothetical protein
MGVSFSSLWFKICGDIKEVLNYILSYRLTLVNAPVSFNGMLFSCKTKRHAIEENMWFLTRKKKDFRDISWFNFLVFFFIKFRLQFYTGCW